MIGIGPIKQAFVRALRDISALQAAVGSEGIDEGVSLTDVEYPRIVYSVSMRRDPQFGTEQILIATITCLVVSDDQVEAHNLDQLILDGLEGVTLDFSDIDSLPDEPSTLLCSRLRDLSAADLDDSGNKVYSVGGTYQVWVA